MPGGLTFESWRAEVRVGIFSSTIALMVQQHIRGGRGAPEINDMRRFAEEAAAVADLWEESTEEESPDGQ